MVAPVVPKLVEGFVHRNHRRPAEIYRLFRMAGNR